MAATNLESFLCKLNDKLFADLFFLVLLLVAILGIFGISECCELMRD